MPRDDEGDDTLCVSEYPHGIVKKKATKIALSQQQKRDTADGEKNIPSHFREFPSHLPNEYVVSNDRQPRHYTVQQLSTWPSRTQEVSAHEIRGPGVKRQHRPPLVALFFSPPLRRLRQNCRLSPTMTAAAAAAAALFPGRRSLLKCLFSPFLPYAADSLTFGT